MAGCGVGLPLGDCRFPAVVPVAVQAALLQALSTAPRCREVLLGTRAQECLWLVGMSLPEQGTYSLIASGH